jgi:hypothetical protein
MSAPVPVPLRSWATVLSGDEFTAPELRRLCLVGDLPDGIRVCTSRVMEKVATRTYRTRSGSLYVLVGEPEPGYRAFLRELKRPLDREDPIAFSVVKESAP